MFQFMDKALTIFSNFTKLIELDLSNFDISEIFREAPPTNYQIQSNVAA